MPLHTLSAAPVASPKRGVLWCVYVYWIYKEKILHPLQNRLCYALCYAGSFFRVVWLPLLWEAELINVWSHETQFFYPFNLFIGHVEHLHSAFPSLTICMYIHIFLFFKYLAFHSDLIHLFGQIAWPLVFIVNIQKAQIPDNSPA